MLVFINCISVHLSWNFYSSVLENHLRAVSKPYIRICFPHIFVEGCGEDDGCVFILFCMNWFLWLIKNLLQVFRSSLLLLVVDLCVLHLLYQCPLVLKLVRGCVGKLYVGRIQTGQTDLIPSQVCGSSWQGRQFLLFYLFSSTDWLAPIKSYQFLPVYFVALDLSMQEEGHSKKHIYKHHSLKFIL